MADAPTAAVTTAEALLAATSGVGTTVCREAARPVDHQALAAEREGERTLPCLGSSGTCGKGDAVTRLPPADVADNRPPAANHGGRSYRRRQPSRRAPGSQVWGWHQ